MSRKKDAIEISEHELLGMTRELDMLHKETFPGVAKTLDEFAANVASLRSKEGTGRRNFLAGMGGAVVLGTVAACSSSGGGNKSSGTNPGPTGGGSGSGSPGGSSQYTGDLKIVALAAALENLAVAGYGLAIKSATAGKYGKVPPAVGVFAQTAMKQHAEHAKGWNGALQKNKLKPVTGTPLTIAAGEVKKLKGAKSVKAVAKIALDLENAAAETYLLAQGAVMDPTGILTAATIEPVETMHAAILSFVLGKYPVPNAFISTKNAVQPSAFTG